MDFGWVFVRWFRTHAKEECYFKNYYWGGEIQQLKNYKYSDITGLPEQVNYNNVEVLFYANTVLKPNQQKGKYKPHNLLNAIDDSNEILNGTSILKIKVIVQI